jgi:hypothetical protein
MGLLDRFRRRAIQIQIPIRDPDALGAFVDEQAFLLAEMSVRDYSRLRAGANADAVLADAAFAAALDKAKWEAYPRALAMTAAVLEGGLRPLAGENSHAMRLGLTAAILAAFDRRTVPPAIGEAGWRAARADLERELGALAHQRPQSVDAVVHEHSSFYLAIMPLHQKLAGDDFPALCRQLTAMLKQIEEVFAQRADSPALAGFLVASGANAPAKAE